MEIKTDIELKEKSDISRNSTIRNLIIDKDSDNNRLAENKKRQLRKLSESERKERIKELTMKLRQPKQLEPQSIQREREAREQRLIIER